MVDPVWAEIYGSAMIVVGIGGLISIALVCLFLVVMNIRDNRMIRKKNGV